MAQPIVELSSEEIVAQELVPMNGIWAGTVSAGVVDIDSWLVDRAAYVAAHGRNVHVSISAASVRTGTFATRIARAVARAGADPASITVEIDEAFAAQETEDAARFARLVVSTGMRVGINDVALRFERSDHLAQIPAHVLKLDPWLVGDMISDYGSAFTVGEIVALAARYGMATIAEGVDGEALIAVLRAGGVDYAQGFHRQRRV